MTAFNGSPDPVLFTPTSDGSIPQPLPSKECLPTWYENLGPNAGDIKAFKNSSAKLCMPLNDSMKLGWILRSPETIVINTNTSSITVPTAPPRDDVAEIVNIESLDTQGNSAFHSPDAVINTKWRISTPDEYGVLIVPPINRPHHQFKPFGMFIPPEEQPAHITIPIHMDNSEITIEQGDWLGQVIPLKPDTLLDSPTLNPTTDTDTFDRASNWIDFAVKIRSGFYREQSWVPKPSTRIFDSINEYKDRNQEDLKEASPTQDFHTPQDREQLLQGNDQVFYCDYDVFDEVPKPSPSEHVIPEKYADHFESLNGVYDVPIGDWVVNATKLGVSVPLGVTVHLNRDQHTGELAAEAEGENRFHILDPRKVGRDHPMSPLQPINMLSHWYPVVKPGYSNLYINPINHFQQEYDAFSGLVDSDRHISSINIPGKIDKSINHHVLHRGMPVTQAISLKRDSILYNGVITDAF